MITTITKKTLPGYITHLHNLLKKNNEITVAERENEDSDKDIDFEGTMEACITDLRQRMKHDHQKA